MTLETEKTRTEIAEQVAQIALSGFPWTANELINAIEQALRDRDERAAKIADALVSDVDSIPDRMENAYAYGKRTAALAIASAIRGKP